jgi:hypothetical protein
MGISHLFQGSPERSQAPPCARRCATAVPWGSCHENDTMIITVMMILWFNIFNLQIWQVCKGYDLSYSCKTAKCITYIYIQYDNRIGTCQPDSAYAQHGWAYRIVREKMSAKLMMRSWPSEKKPRMPGFYHATQSQKVSPQFDPTLGGAFHHESGWFTFPIDTHGHCAEAPTGNRRSTAGSPSPNLRRWSRFGIFQLRGFQ